MGQKITMSAAADRSGMSPRTIRRYVARNMLRAFRTPTGTIRIDVDDLNALFEEVAAGAAERNASRLRNLATARQKRWSADRFAGTESEVSVGGAE